MAWTSKFMKTVELPDLPLPVDLYLVTGPRPGDLLAVAIDSNNIEILKKLLRALATTEG